MNQREKSVSLAKLAWSEDGQPLSSEFDDVYFSKANGLEETRYVFLHHNRLRERWLQLPTGGHFVTAETGFGTGLNFLAAWQLWRETAPNTATLHFISVEKHPVSRADLQTALALWPELQGLAQELTKLYPAELNGDFHHLQFDNQRVRLTLIIGDATQGFDQLLRGAHPSQQLPQRGIDAWFLDGFAPAKNPDMWQPELFKLIHKLSAPQATAATFTAAGIVKRGLKENGFDIEKVEGFGHKRDMIRGELRVPFVPPASETFTSSSFNSPNEAPWYCPDPTELPEHKNIAIVGGGLAGCHIARALADRDYHVTLLERNEALAQEASGNPQGVLYVKLSHRQETLSDFNLAALQYAQRHYGPLWKKGSELGQACGVLQLAQSDKQTDLMRQLADTLSGSELVEFVSPEDATAIAGIPLQQPALHYKGAGWLSPAAICRQLVDHPKIQVIYRHEVSRLEPMIHGDWQLYDQNGALTLTANQVVLCCANQTAQLAQTKHLPLKPVRGQISQLPADEQSARLQTVLCAEGYIAPAYQGNHCLGASFDLHTPEPVVTEEDHAQNLTRLHEQFPSLTENRHTADSLEGRAALRCTTPDYLPLVGAAPNHADFVERFDLLRKNAKSEIPHCGSYHQNLYISCGYGSRGLAYIPLCTEILAAQMAGEPDCVSRDTRKALSPARFIVRNLIRGKL